MSEETTNGAALEPATDFHERKFNEQQIALIRDRVAKECDEVEFSHFLYVCRRRGLDPLLQQIYAIKRGGKMVIQTAIDGFRLIAHRTGAYAGKDAVEWGPSVAPNPKHPEVVVPHSARVTVHRLVQGTRCAFTGEAFFLEFVQRTSSGAPATNWLTMPHVMIAKCAEAQALRAAFPEELSGLYIHEEMMQADNPVTGQASGTRVAATRSVQGQLTRRTEPEPPPMADESGDVAQPAGSTARLL